MVNIYINGNEFGGEITLHGTNIAKEKQFNTDAGICIYGRGVYLYTRTNRYWHDSSRGNVIELRDAKGKKVKDVGTKEIKDYDPQYWGNMEREGRKIPEKVKNIYKKVFANRDNIR